MTQSLTRSSLLATLLLCACGSDKAAPLPPPPVPSSPVVAQPEPAAPADEAEPVDEDELPDAPADEGEPKRAEREQKSGAVKGDSDKPAAPVKGTGSLYDLAKQGKATLPTTTAPKTKTPPAATATTKPATPTAPAPATKPATKPPLAAKPATKVVVPSTANLSVVIPKGLQALLDADPRMQPWVKQVVSVADKCYATERKKNPLAKGDIEVRLTMHENERPDASPKVPPQLGSLVACVTGPLMRVKMPLFTGKEGEKHTVKLRFTP